MRKLELLSSHSVGHEREVLRNLWVSPVPLSVHSVLYTRLGYELLQLLFTVFEGISPYIVAVLAACDVDDVAPPPFCFTSVLGLSGTLIRPAAALPSHGLYDDLLCCV